MREQNPRQSRDDRMQSPSMASVANPQPSHGRNPWSQDHGASQQRSSQKGRDSLASSSQKATAQMNKPDAQLATVHQNPVTGTSNKNDRMPEYSSKSQYMGQGEHVTSGQHMTAPYLSQHIGGSSQSKKPQRNHDGRPKGPPLKPDNLRGNPLPQKNATLP